MTQVAHSCGFLYNPKTREILMHLRDDKAISNPNKWALFGGKIEIGETPAECFVREIKEELNIDLNIKKLRLMFNYLNPEFNTERYVFYVESNLPRSVMILGEGADFDWVSIDKVLALDLSLRARADLEVFIKGLNK